MNYSSIMNGIFPRAYTYIICIKVETLQRIEFNKLENLCSCFEPYA